MMVATLLVLGCSSEAATDPAPTPPGAPELKSASVPSHSHGVDLSFSGVVPCAEVGIDIQAEFDYHIIVDASFFPQRNVFHTVPREVELVHRNLETGATVIGTGGEIQTDDLDAGTLTLTGSFKYRGTDGKILLKNAGRLVLGPSGVEFEAGQHPQFEPDFITFIGTALS